MDADGYPEESELELIRDWPPGDAGHYQGWLEMLAYVKARWWSPDWGWTEGTNQDGQPTFSISTGGWSGNEDLIRAMQENLLFWAMCWESSRRGGHYELEVPVTRRQQTA